MARKMQKKCRKVIFSAFLGVRAPLTSTASAASNTSFPSRAPLETKKAVARLGFPASKL